MDESFARLLRRYRTRAGLTLSELAEALGADRSSIRAWEQGQRVPRDRARLADLAQVLQLPPAEAVTLAAAARTHDDPDAALVSQTEAGAQVTTAGTVPGTPIARHHLRAPIGDFVGRTAEIATLQHALLRALQAGGAAICGVRGMGGIGKTELAYRVAHDLRATFPDAQIVLNLRGASAGPLTPEQALQHVIRIFSPAATLPDDLPALEALYRAQLHAKHVLILADDARDAAQVRALLPPAGCALLITSRQCFSLPGMTTLDLEQLPFDQAGSLLQQLCPRLSADEAGALASACSSLPLALRVSGSLLHNDPALPASDYLARLADDRCRLAALRDPDDPQLDVAATLALSYDRLDRPAQAVFRQLGVFVTDFSIELAQVVVEDEASPDVAEVLRMLLRRNLLQYDSTHRRWRLHDLVRDLARQRLEAAGEAEPTHWRYVQAAVQLATCLHAQHRSDKQAALAQFDREQPHLEAAWQWTSQHAASATDDRLLLELVNSSYCLSRLRDDVQYQRLPKLEAALAAARRLNDLAEECRTLNRLGVAYRALGRIRVALSHYQAALPIARKIGDTCSEGMLLNNLGLAYQNLGQLEQALACYTQRLALARAHGDQRGECITLGNLALAEAEIGRPQQAIPTYERALMLARTLGDQLNESIMLSNLALAYAAIEQTQQAQAHAGAALALAQALGSQRQEAYARSALARIRAIHAEPEAAFALFALAWSDFQAVGDRMGQAECEWQWGLALLRYGAPVEALTHLRAALTYEQAIGHAQAEEHARLAAEIEQGHYSFFCVRDSPAR